MSKWTIPNNADVFPVRGGTHKEKTMTIFNIQVGKDARVYYSAKIEAKSLQDVKDQLHRSGYDSSNIIGEWKHDGTDSFDNVETAHISDEANDIILASYEAQDGWRDFPLKDIHKITLNDKNIESMRQAIQDGNGDGEPVLMGTVENKFNGMDSFLGKPGDQNITVEGFGTMGPIVNSEFDVDVDEFGDPQS